MKDFGFLEADLKSKELRSFCKAICYLLQGRFSVFTEGSIISKT